MFESLTFRRANGTFVGIVNQAPYHIVQSDPLFLDAVAMAAVMGDALPYEPAPEPMPPAPIVLTNRQLFIALNLTGFITEAEALAAARMGAVPAAIDTIFAELPDQDAFAARVTWATMREVSRNHPLISTMIAASLATSEQVDAIFTLGASIP
jgi:hypothetical protein